MRLGARRRFLPLAVSAFLPRSPLLAVLVAAWLSGPRWAGAGTDPRIICQPCTSPDQCGDALDLCLDYHGIGGSGVYCGMHCAGDADCYGLLCLETTAGLSQCADLDGLCRSGPPIQCGIDSHCPAGEVCEGGRCVGGGPAGLGDPCSDGAPCTSGLECVLTFRGEICTQGCNWLAPTSCPAGMFCTERNRCGDGICAPGTAGEAGLGEPCALDVDCAGLFCSTPPGTGSALCSLPCDPSADGCPTGTHCGARGPTCGTCVEDCQPGECPPGETCRDGRCVGRLPDGSACAAPEDCASGVCQSGVCGGTAPDGGPGDSGPVADAGIGPALYVGACACRTAGRGESAGPALTLTTLLAATLWRRRGRAGSPR